MGKKPNAANMTHGLAQLGGGSKKEGGEGMIGGMKNIFATGVKYGIQFGLEGQDITNVIDKLTNPFEKE